jgi:uncharacterized protein with PQ loop repeat
MNIVGLIGSLSLTVCAIPEVYRTVKDKRCHLGWGFLLLWLIGEIFCFVYGLQLNQIPMIINYSFNLLVVSIMTSYKIKQLIDKYKK